MEHAIAKPAAIHGRTGISSEVRRLSSDTLEVLHMLMLGIGAVVVVAIVAWVALQRGSRSTDLGTMSDRWVTLYNASRH